MLSIKTVGMHRMQRLVLVFTVILVGVFAPVLSDWDRESRHMLTLLHSSVKNSANDNW